MELLQILQKTTFSVISMHPNLSCQIVQDQAEKISLPRLVMPTKMGKTTRTCTAAPGEAGKPGKFAGRDAMNDATISVGKASDTVRDAGGIDKRIFVPAVYRGAVLGIRYLIPTRLTEEGIFFFFRFRFIFRFQTDESDLIIRKLFEGMCRLHR